MNSIEFFVFETYLIISIMSSTNLNDALDAVLDAASASVAGVTSKATSTPSEVTSAVSKSQFVSFDVLSDSRGGLGSHAVAVEEVGGGTDIVIGAGIGYDDGADGVDGIVGGGETLSAEVGDEEGVLEVWKTDESVIDSPHLLFVGNDVSTLCRAAPPGASKWCYNRNCLLKAHVKHSKEEVEKGLYLKAGGRGSKKDVLLAHLSPHVPFEFVWGKGYVKELLDSVVKRSVIEWEHLFQVINMKNGDFDSLVDLESCVNDLRIDSKSFQTPAKPRTLGLLKYDSSSEKVEVDPMKNVLETLTETFSVKKELYESEIGLTSQQYDNLKDSLLKIANYAASKASLLEVQEALQFLQGQQESTMAKVVDVLSAIGDRSKGTRVQHNVFLELAQLSDGLERLGQTMTDWEKKRNLSSDLIVKVGDLDAMTKQQFDKVAKIFQNVMKQQSFLGKELEAIKECFEKTATTSYKKRSSSALDILLGGDDVKGPGGYSGTLGGMDGSTNDHKVVEVYENRLEKLEMEMKQLRLELDQVKSVDASDGDVLEIGGLRFTSRDNLLLWASNNLPVVIPYGCFVDVYSFLNRMIDGAGYGLHELVDQHRLGLAGDDAVTLESFQQPLPKLFGNSTKISEFKSSHRSWIPSMPSASFWEDPKSSMGIKDRLRKQIPNLKSQVMANINLRLGGHPVGYSLAVSCLEATVSFINSFAVWITDTHLRLTSHGYSVSLSWQLITQVMFHVFTGDLDKSRNFVRDGTNTTNTQTLHGSILWGIFRTHEAMQSYMHHGFSAHPAVASQYLDFLVNSRGQDHEDKETEALKAIKVLETQLNAVDKLAKEAKSAAGDAKNGVSQLKTKVSNLRGGSNGNSN